jgi:hypothetical protein
MESDQGGVDQVILGCGANTGTDCGEVGKWAESATERGSPEPNKKCGRPSDHGEIKKPHCINLTDSAWKIWGEIASPSSRSEWLERHLRKNNE